MTLYRHEFFKTKEEAKAFQKENGGAFYSHKSHRRAYNDELMMYGGDEEFAKEHPYVIAWNSSI